MHEIPSVPEHQPTHLRAATRRRPNRRGFLAWMCSYKQSSSILQATWSAPGTRP